MTSQAVRVELLTESVFFMDRFITAFTVTARSTITPAGARFIRK
jgi:hypothetical protein